jgi:hypothetical protein
MNLRPMAALLLGLAACVGSSDATDGTATAVESDAAAPVKLVAEAWPVALRDSAARAPFESEKGWITHVVKRNYKRSVEQIGGDKGLATARVHADAADLYRQGAMLAANSLISTYGDMADPTDPIGTGHLLAVSYALNGRLDEARASSKKLGDAADPTQEWHGPWRTWLDGDATWPPDLSGLPIELPEPTAGSWPSLALPLYDLPEQTEDKRSREMADPSALVALAMWHDKAAHIAAGEQGSALDTYSARYRFPIQGPVENPVDLPIEFLFGSDFLSAADGPYLAEVLGSDGSAAVDKYADRSLLAWLTKNSQTDGVFDVVVANEKAVQLRTLLVEQQAVVTNGTVEGHHRMFADIGQVGTMRNLGFVGEALVDREMGGKARLIARDLASDSSDCPIGSLSLASWDAANKFPMRALDIVNAQARRYSSLESARYAVDVLALRAGRRQIDQSPG